MNKRVMGIVLAATAAVLLAGPAVAAVPGSMVVEGVLTSAGGGAAADGDYDMTFSLYETDKGGAAVWSETAKVAAKAGRFSHALGASKTLSAVTLAGLKGQWVGLKVGADPEMPRAKLHSTLFSMYSAWAGKLKCSGCVGAGQIANGSVSAVKAGFAYAASTTKGGPATNLACSGCVSVDEMKFDKHVNLGAWSLSAGKVTSKGNIVAGGSIAGKQFIGDGSQLTGIGKVTGECKNAGEVVKGINADGSFKCVKALDPSALPKDGLYQISNGQLSTQFTDPIVGGKKKAIADNSPPGILDIIKFPDIGIAQDITVNIDITNSNTAALVVHLFPPSTPKLPTNRATILDKTGKIQSPKTYPHYTLHYKKQFDAKNKTTLKTSFPKPTKELTGSIHGDWLNKNIKGEWRLLIIDTAFLDNNLDGYLNGWNITVKTLSNKQVNVTGSQYVGGTLWGKYQGSGKAGGALNVGGGIKLGKPTKCDAAEMGTLRYDHTWGLQVCRRNWDKKLKVSGYIWGTAQSRPIVWSGGCKKHSRGTGWDTYCLDGLDWQTAVTARHDSRRARSSASAPSTVCRH